MARRSWAIWCIVVAFLLAITFVAIPQQQAQYYLTGNLGGVGGTVTTDKGKQETSFSGAIGFRIVPGEKSGLTMSLVTFNLVAKGVPTAAGDSGVIGLLLAEPEYKGTYDPRTGQIAVEFQSILHYGLIDQKKGYLQRNPKGEADLFASYTERMAGKLTGKLPANLQPAEKGSIKFDGEVTLTLSSAVLGAVRDAHLLATITIDWSRVFALPAQLLKVQPVFIGTGPTDPHATGTAFNTLMNYANVIWNKCGTVRCLKLVVNPAIYINNEAYRVLDSDAEIAALRALANVPDAVEVFVVERWETNLACGKGGGACYSCGTASAQIVSSDQQLAVPCPCPSACTGYCPCGACVCGAVNFYHLAHELGHALNLAHPPGPDGSLAASTVSSNMEPSGFCCDNPSTQSSKNCRNASSPLLYWGTATCTGVPDIKD